MVKEETREGWRESEQPRIGTITGDRDDRREGRMKDEEREERDGRKKGEEKKWRK